MNKISKNQELENKFRWGVKSNPENSLNITREKDWYREKIVEMINNIEDLWILEQILKCIINITK